MKGKGYPWRERRERATCSLSSARPPLCKSNDSTSNSPADRFRHHLKIHERPGGTITSGSRRSSCPPTTDVPANQPDQGTASVARAASFSGATPLEPHFQFLHKVFFFPEGVSAQKFTATGFALALNLKYQGFAQKLTFFRVIMQIVHPLTLHCSDRQQRQSPVHLFVGCQHHTVWRDGVCIHCAHRFAKGKKQSCSKCVARAELYTRTRCLLRI